MIRALLVEDHYADAVLLTAWLELADVAWTLEHVETFAQAGECWAAGGYDALLLDMDIPDGFGMDLLRRALDLAGPVPVVVFSGLAHPEVAAQALALGARAYLVKGEAAVPDLLAAVPDPA